MSRYRVRRPGDGRELVFDAHHFNTWSLDELELVETLNGRPSPQWGSAQDVKADVFISVQRHEADLRARGELGDDEELLTWQQIGQLKPGDIVDLPDEPAAGDDGPPGGGPSSPSSSPPGDATPPPAFSST